MIGTNGRRAGMISDLEAMAARATLAAGALEQRSDFRNRAWGFAGWCNDLRDDLVVEERCGDLLGVGFRCAAGGYSFRCGICERMQPGSAVCVMVPEYMETKGLTRDLLIRELALEDDCYGCCENCARDILHEVSKNGETTFVNRLLGR